MLLLFAAGVMTLWWVAALSVVVFVERVGPWRRRAERLIGVGCLAAAGWIALAR
jgi:predicted metal-binding membrane protein